MGKESKTNTKIPKSKAITTIKKICLEFKKTFPFTRCIIFGSHAKGLARKDSDIDICFVFPDRIADLEPYRTKISIELNFRRQIAADVIAVHEKRYKKDMLSPLLHEVRTYGFEI